jgi:hypothetical protein
MWVKGVGGYPPSTIRDSKDLQGSITEDELCFLGFHPAVPAHMMPRFVRCRRSGPLPLLYSSQIGVGLSAFNRVHPRLA